MWCMISRFFLSVCVCMFLFLCVYLFVHHSYSNLAKSSLNIIRWVYQLPAVVVTILVLLCQRLLPNLNGSLSLEELIQLVRKCTAFDHCIAVC